MRIGGYVFSVRRASDPVVEDIAMAVRRSVRERLRDREDDLRQMIAKVARSAAKDFFEEQAEAYRDRWDAAFEQRVRDARDAVMAALAEEYGITPSSAMVTRVECLDEAEADAVREIRREMAAEAGDFDVEDERYGS